MATRWVNRINPLSWITRRSPRTAPVVPGGQAEFATPAAYQNTVQDDYSAADRPSFGQSLEWFAEEPNQPEGFSQVIGSTVTMNPVRPRTHMAEYDEGSQTLRITYREGASYDYPGVTPAQWQSLMSERTSTGKWLARNGLAGPGSGIRV
jgi:hypothetical protein